MYRQSESFSYFVNSEVSQGSNLSPLFFILYTQFHTFWVALWLTLKVYCLTVTQNLELL
jgi:hypothetical protein